MAVVQCPVTVKVRNIRYRTKAKIDDYAYGIDVKMSTRSLSSIMRTDRINLNILYTVYTITTVGLT